MNKRTLTKALRTKIVAAGRRKERGSAGEVADSLKTDPIIVRRVWQAAGLTEVPPETKERAQRLVATWLERGKA